MQVETTSAPMERMLIFRTFPGLAGASLSSLSLLAEHAVERVFKKGTVIVPEHSGVTKVHWIVEGKVTLFRSGARIHQLGAREIVGSLHAISRDLDSPEVVADEDTYVLEIDIATMEDILEDNFELLLRGLKGLTRQVIQTRLLSGRAAGFKPEFCSFGVPPGRLTMIEKIDYMSRSFAFADGRIETISELARHAKEIRPSRGEILWKQGDSALTYL